MRILLPCISSLLSFLCGWTSSCRLPFLHFVTNVVSFWNHSLSVFIQDESKERVYSIVTVMDYTIQWDKPDKKTHITLGKEGTTTKIVWKETRRRRQHEVPSTTEGLSWQAWLFSNGGSWQQMEEISTKDDNSLRKELKNIRMCLWRNFFGKSWSNAWLCCFFGIFCHRCITLFHGVWFVKEFLGLWLFPLTLTCLMMSWSISWLHLISLLKEWETGNGISFASFLSFMRLRDCHSLTRIDEVSFFVSRPFPARNFPKVCFKQKWILSSKWEGNSSLYLTMQTCERHADHHQEDQK
jgi:hypothetical protein